jgi:predicted dithiol-disulfide oxidoreductase (DUF899 family)
MPRGADGPEPRRSPRGIAFRCAFTGSVGPDHSGTTRTPGFTVLLVSQAPLAKLQAYKQRMGWSLPWVSSANTDFNVDFGGSYRGEQVRSWGLDEGALPPIVAQNAAATGTDVPGYLSESPAVSVFTRQDGTVYQTYATAGRGVEFLMGYYPILDRTPKGRDEGDAFQTWIRRHDEYA